LDLHTLCDEFLAIVAKVRKAVKKGKSVQVTSLEERDLLKSTAGSWFNSFRTQLQSGSESALGAVDEALRRVINATAKSSARTTYLSALNDLRESLLTLRESLPTVAPQAVIQATTDDAPNFAPLASDLRMQSIMERRWRECVACLGGGANLAAVVMMGGLLESLFVSKQNRMPDKSALLSAARRPQKQGKTVPLQDWTLNNYIEVGNELGWIGDAAKRISVVVRDYRNFVHPHAEYTQQASLSQQDARLTWDVTKAVVRELLTSP
jgi:hypothetical protein